MYTLALAARYVEEWAGPGRVVTFGAKFTKPVVVPVEGRTSWSTALSSDGTGSPSVALKVTCEGVEVLRRVQGRTA